MFRETAIARKASQNSFSNETLVFFLLITTECLLTGIYFSLADCIEGTSRRSLGSNTAKASPALQRFLGGPHQARFCYYGKHPEALI
jgi:hypothetical protein